MRINFQIAHIYIPAKLHCPMGLMGLRNMTCHYELNGLFLINFSFSDLNFERVKFFNKKLNGSNGHKKIAHKS